MSTTPAASQDSKQSPPGSDSSVMGGAVGAGTVLVLLPGAALFFGVDYLDARPSIGLPIVALFGIMMLVGTLALTSTLFSRLGLARRSEPLAMPPGSVRATIALALIVLFAIIVNSTQRPSGNPYQITGLTLDAKNEVLKDGKLQILVSTVEPCAAAVAKTLKLANPRDLAPPPAVQPTACASADQRFSVTVQAGPSPSAVELSKQLQAQIIQLLSTVIAFYFATRAVAKGVDPAVAKPADPKVGDQNAADSKNGQPPAGAVAGAPFAAPATALALAPAPPGDAHDDHLDGCNVPITNPTPDHELPAAQGGVVPK